MSFPAFILVEKGRVTNTQWDVLKKYERIRNGSRERLSIIPSGRAAEILDDAWKRYQDRGEE